MIVYIVKIKIHTVESYRKERKEKKKEERHELTAGIAKDFKGMLRKLKIAIVIGIKSVHLLAKHDYGTQ